MADSTTSTRLSPDTSRPLGVELPEHLRAYLQTLLLDSRFLQLLQAYQPARTYRYQPGDPLEKVAHMQGCADGERNFLEFLGISVD